MTNIEIIVNALLDNGVIEEEKALELLEEEELKNFKSFEEWKRLGFSVKKGERRLASCRIWRPEEIENEDGSKGTRFVKRWANIFSKKQVEKTADRKARRELEKANAQKTEEPKKAEEPKANSQKAKKAEPKAKKELANTKTETPKAEPKKNSQKAKANSKKAVAKTAKTAKTNSQTAKLADHSEKIKEKAQRPFINMSNKELAEYISRQTKWCESNHKNYPSSGENSFDDYWLDRANEELAIRTAKKTQSKTAKATKKLENTNKTKAVKNAKNVTKKAEVGVMTSTIEDGIEIIKIDLTKADGNKAWIKLTKDFYMGLSKTKKRELEKVWGLA